MDEYNLKVSNECALELGALLKKWNREVGEYTQEELDAAEADLRKFSIQFGGNTFANSFIWTVLTTQGMYLQQHFNSEDSFRALNLQVPSFRPRKPTREMH